MPCNRQNAHLLEGTLQGHDGAGERRIGASHTIDRQHSAWRQRIARLKMCTQPTSVDDSKGGESARRICRLYDRIAEEADGSACASVAGRQGGLQQLDALLNSDLLEKGRSQEGGRRAGHGARCVARAGVHDDGVPAAGRRRPHRC